jgi:hypothetical protein
LPYDVADALVATALRYVSNVLDGPSSLKARGKAE